MNDERIRLKCKGLKVEVEVSETGVTLWVKDCWIVDASNFTKDKEIRVSDNLKLNDSPGWPVYKYKEVKPK